MEERRLAINEHHQAAFFNKSACIFIRQGKETVAELNMWGLPTSGEEGVVIGARRTETKKNSLEFPASRYDTVILTVLCM